MPCTFVDQHGKVVSMKVMKTAEGMHYDWHWNWELIMLTLSSRLFLVNGTEKRNLKHWHDIV